MIFIFAIAVSLLFFGAKPAKLGSFNRDYLSKDITGNINGLFVILVFMCHISGYMDLSSTVGEIWIDVKNWIGQLVVVTFLFYSGYGMMLSIMRKGTSYVKNIFKCKFLSLLAHFDIAVLLFLVMDILLEINPGLKKTLLALTTWDTIGNSNWYITAVLCLYLIMIISFLVFRKNALCGIISMTVLTVGLTVLLIAVGRPSWYYNTLIIFPMGMWYAYFKKSIDKIVIKSRTSYITALVIASAVFGVSHMYRFIYFLIYWICAAAFMFIILLVSMKLKVGNPVLSLFGRHVFGVYILQHIPMTVFKKFGLASNIYVFFILSFAATLLMAIVFDALMKKLDAKVFTPKAKA